MAKRDPEKTARNRIIEELTEQLEDLLPDVLSKTGFESQQSLNAKIGSKFDKYIDIKNEVINSPEHFISLWLQGYTEDLNSRGKSMKLSNAYKTYILLRRHEVFKNYLFIFLKRVYLRNFEALSKKRPKIEEAEIYIGQENASYGILVTPRFVNGKWENDKSEIRHFKKQYWSIGHILKTGFVIPGIDDKIQFRTIKEYLNFFKNVIVRNSGSKYEKEIANQYSAYVLNHDNPESIPLLIPEFRYDGLVKDHKYRLDFTIIEPIDLNKIGFELSPWSSHGYLKKLKRLTQRKINEMAQDNFEKEMKKHKDFFRKHGIFSMIYTDDDLSDIEGIFSDMKRYLTQKTSGRQLKLHILDDFFLKPLS